MLKTYVLISNSNLTTSIFDGDIEYTVEFKGGSLSPKFIAGQFLTQNTKLQTAIEKDSCYGTIFIAKKIVEEKKETNVEDLKHEDKILNKQLALEWIEQKFGERLPIKISIQSIKNYALEKGVVFDNLNK
ncbi:MAG: hypothetical protein IMY73_01735 [Bacteroidetes bacterium]|nr:hypothetical protein [Bacteroidota bacterium]